MSDEQASCACRKVEYSPVENNDGTMTERWVCVLCGGEFDRNRRALLPDAQEKDEAHPSR